jgi:hypothetical protein
VVQVPAEKPTKGGPAEPQHSCSRFSSGQSRDQTRAELIGQRLPDGIARKPALKPLNTQAALDSLIGHRGLRAPVRMMVRPLISRRAVAVSTMVSVPMHGFRGFYLA